MPYKKLEDKQKHNKKYYLKNHKKIIAKHKLSIERNRENWKHWFLKKKNQERKEKIKSRQVYKPKVF